MNTIKDDGINQHFRAVVSESDHGLICLLAGSYRGMHMLFASESGYVVNMVDCHGEPLPDTVMLGSEAVIDEAKRSIAESEMDDAACAYVSVTSEIFSSEQDGVFWHYAKNFGNVTVMIAISTEVAEALTELLSVVLENFQLPGPSGWELTPSYTAVDIHEFDYLDDDDDDDDEPHFHAYPFPSRN